MRGGKVRIVLTLLLLLGIQATPGFAQAIKSSTNPDKWDLSWNDEFDINGLPDKSKWKFQTGDGGWGNNELQHYTDRKENARVEDGRLILEMRKEKYKKSNYTSSRINSKQSWTYGRIEIRAKVPKGRGTWPALWMMPTNDGRYNGGKWPDNGEIDIMEHVGFDQDVVHASYHTKNFNWIINTQKTAKIKVNDVTQYHVYAIEWDKDQISNFVDGKKFYSFANPKTDHKDWPFDQPFFLIMNVAMGGNWGAQKGVDEAVTNARMEIDYVRAFRPAVVLEQPKLATIEEASNILDTN